MSDYLRFFKNSIRHPLSVGAIAPSSRWLARRMVADSGASEANTVVELGPGTGAFTSAIEEALSDEALFLALEINESFAESLSKRFSRAKIIHDSAENIGTHLREHDREFADTILCGLPWAAFPEELQTRIMNSVMESLKPGGTFCSFAYSHVAWLPSAQKFRRWLERHFTTVTASPAVWRNVPPAFVYRCEK